jgi:hypothetical protein
MIRAGIRNYITRRFSASARTKQEHKVLGLIERFREDAFIDEDYKEDVIREVRKHVNTISRSTLAEVLVASGYYGILDQEQYDTILSQLSRIEPIKEDKPSVTTNTKIFELMLRCGLVPNCSYTIFSQYSQRFLLRSRSKPVDHNRLSSSQTSSFKTELRELVEDLPSDYHKDVVIGPYVFDFIRPNEPGVSFKPATVTSDLKLLLKKYICVNAIERSEMTDEGKLKPLAKIKSAIIHALSPRIANIYFTDWNQLGQDNLRGKKTYLSSVIGNVK